MEKYITPNPVVKSFLAGSASGTCSSLFFQPLDLVKTRLQQNVASSHQQQRQSPPRIGGSIAVVRAVVSGSERGILALWTGLVPSITRTVPGVGLYFGSIEALKDLRSAAAAAGNSKASNWMAGDFALGVAARCISASVMNPVSVVKTRFESAANPYRGVGHALATICRLEGARGLTCGLAPTIFRDAPYSGFYFMFYTQVWILQSIMEDMKF